MFVSNQEVLAAIRAGATTSDRLANALGIGGPHAQALYHAALVAGHVKWSGEMVPRVSGQRGRLCRVYEVV